MIQVKWMIFLPLKKKSKRVMHPSFTTQRVDLDELYYPPRGIVIRAGVIPFIVSNEERYYLLGIFPDNVFTDMGGGCKTSRRERPIDCLLREINEETDSVTAQVVTDTLSNQNKNIEVWRQTARSFRDFGYPFQQRRAGPIHRYYVFLEIDDPEMKLGGLTHKDEVDSYRWVSSKELKNCSRDLISSSMRDFFISQDLTKS